MRIFDCRPFTNAYANRVKGGGYENVKQYLHSQLDFLEIPNIHVVRDKFMIMRNSILNKKNISPMTYHTNVAPWLQLIQELLASASKVVTCLREEKCSVLVHCSDGWDRTAQITSLARILIDPNARSRGGFYSLVYQVRLITLDITNTQEWILAGHKFRSRLHKKSEENSPVFVQFMEAVRVLVRHYKTKFEINENDLLTLLEEAVCPTTATFTMDCDIERRRLTNLTSFFYNQLVQEYPDNDYQNSTAQTSNSSDEYLNVADIACDEYDVWKEYYERPLPITISL